MVKFGLLFISTSGHTDSSPRARKEKKLNKKCFKGLLLPRTDWTGVFSFKTLNLMLFEKRKFVRGRFPHSARSTDN